MPRGDYGVQLAAARRCRGESICRDDRSSDDGRPTADSGEPKLHSKRNFAPTFVKFQYIQHPGANIFNAATHYSLGGFRILGNAGTNNLFAGVGAGVQNTTGVQNAFLGARAGFANTTGTNNTFVGITPARRIRQVFEMLS